MEKVVKLTNNCLKEMEEWGSYTRNDSSSILVGTEHC